MDSNISTSKGIFVYKPFDLKKRKKKIIQEEFCDELWYKNYKKFWNFINTKLKQIQDNIFSNVIMELVKHVRNCDFNQKFIPSIGFLTGTNLSDHNDIFQIFKKNLQESVTSYVAVLDSKKCSTLKNTIEHLISQYLLSPENQPVDDEDDEQQTYHFTKKDCNFPILEAWYKSIKENESFYDKEMKDPFKKLIVIIPDFENFNRKCLQDLISIINGYVTKIPFVLVFGISTTLTALHRTFPFHISSLLSIDVFHSIRSSDLLNKIIEEIFLSPEMPLFLGSKPFNFLIDVFLFYDFSIKGFTQGFKYFLMEHFFSKNHLSICCESKDLKNEISALKTNELDDLRSISSFRRYVEKQDLTERKKLLLDDEYFKDILFKFLKDIDNYWFNFNLAIKCLQTLIKDLPREFLGKNLRQIYPLAMQQPICEYPEFKDTMPLLLFQSKEDLLDKIEKIFSLVSENDIEEEEENNLFKKFLADLSESLNSFIEAAQEEDLESQENDTLLNSSNLVELKEYLLTKSKKPRVSEKYEKARAELLRTITGYLSQALRPPTHLPLHETRLISDITSIRGRVTGSPRAAIHMALTNPQYYLQCDCCQLLATSDITPSLPDISIAYKLHLECGRLINLYDWLQSFSAVITPLLLNEDDNPKKIDPIVQARFTRSVAELQHLGFIKPSKRKTDHVMRLTWGTS